MRKLLLILLLFPFVSSSQSRSTVPVKKTNKIVVRNDKSGRENFVLLQSVLLSKNYTLIINRRDFTVNTRDSSIESGSSSFNGVAKHDSVILTGKYKSRVVTSIFGQEEEIYTYDITNTGSKGTLPQMMFLLLDNIAKEIKGDRVYIYEKKKRKGAIF